jgi:hypothetical protein
VARDGVTVMALCPGATATGFQETAGAWVDQRDSMPSPDEVVADGLRAFERRRHRFVPGLANRLMSLAARLGPRSLILHLTAREVNANRS